MEGEKQRRMAKIWVRGFKILGSRAFMQYIQDDDHYLTKRVVLRDKSTYSKKNFFGAVGTFALERSCSNVTVEGTACALDHSCPIHGCASSGVRKV